ncbi:MAG: hypothetical protein CMP61_03975 [Flavobacteriales bacterium]|nr:hypothetical protein [Flavobacteriales bacterium]|tara:strand:- start:348 stop:923 length:576 start_codon:yes stop_codon:yes gene_type:complete
MRSSYQSQLEYGAIIDTVIFMQRSKRSIKNSNVLRVVEFGILDGYSLERFARHNAEIYAYDIFDKFQGNHARRDDIEKHFSSYSNVYIEYGDFYMTYEKFEDNSIDILHIDIANNGDVAEFMFEHYMRKLKPDGIVIFEGGSEERDQVEWMRKYNKSHICPIFKKHKDTGLYEIMTLGNMPSLTLVQKVNT